MLLSSTGVRPIGIGELPRRIIARAVLSVLRDDVQDAAGSVQLCAGQIAGSTGLSRKGLVKKYGCIVSMLTVI